MSGGFTLEQRDAPIVGVPDRNAPFFIVGCGRSGTTLLRTIMLTHSRLHIGPETHFIRWLVKDLPLSTPLSPEQASEATTRIVSHPRWPVMGIAADGFQAEAKSLDAPRMADILNLIYRRQLDAAGKERSGDKTPDYVRIVPQILAIYPDAKFIHLIRDGRDVAISYANVDWGHAYQGSRFEWTRAVRATLGYRKTKFADRVLEVRYEDMVSHLEATIRRICSFLGEDFEPAMLQWHGSVDTVMRDEQFSLHAKLYQPIPPDAAEIWRRKLSTLECFLIEASIHRDLEAIGYALRFSGPLWRPLLASVGGVMRGLAPLLDRGLPALRRRNILRKPLYI